MAKRNIKDTLPQYVLPSENGELETFARKFKTDMMERVISSIEFGLKNDLPYVEVFEFKDSDFIITIPQKDFLVNLDHIYEFYVDSESYEKCPRLVMLQQTLKGKAVSQTPSHEKIKS